ncbi:hypothetical protein ABTK13_22745, partial [Acinetobacter baumannii]
ELPGQVPQQTKPCGAPSHVSSRTRQIVVFYAPFPELRVMIYKMCHAARAYLVVDGETRFTAANELRDTAQRVAKV